MGIAKVTLNNETLMDITDDTVTASGLMLGDTAHAANGESVTGTYEPVTYDVATETTDGLMSASDKVKLNGIATGAEVNQNAFSNVKVGTTTIAADSETDTLTLTAGTNITLTPNATSDSVTIAVNGMPSKVSDLDNDSGFITSSGTASNVSGTVAIEHGGTGATSASAARTNLGLGSAATASTSSTVGNNSSLPTGAAVQSYVTGLGYTTNTGTVTSIATGAGLTGGTITGSGTIKADLKSETKSSLTAASKGSTANREYAVGLDANGDLSVNVPWEDTQTITGVKGSSESSYRTGNVSISASNIGLGNVENKSSATIRGELTKSNVTTALGFTPYTQDEVNALVSSVFTYKGTKSTYAQVSALTDMKTGDVWQVTEDNSEYVYNGSSWEKLGPTIDLSGYLTSVSVAGQSLTPSANSITAAQLKTALGLGSAAYVDTESTVANDSKVPTGAAVKSFVEGKGYTTNTGTVTSVATGTGLTGGPITTSGTISLEGGVVTAGSAGPTAAVTGNEGNTVAIPRITVDEYGRVTGLTSYNLTNKNTTYTAATSAPGNVASSSAVGTSANYARQDHTHGISLATGDANGQVKIAGTNVSVKGWNTAATYDVESTLANDSKLPTGAAVTAAINNATDFGTVGSNQNPVYFNNGDPTPIAFTFGVDDDQNVQVAWDGDAPEIVIPTTSALAISSGGTGATTAAGARTNLGLGSAATYQVVSAVQDDENLVTNGAVKRYVDGVIDGLGTAATHNASDTLVPDATLPTGAAVYNHTANRTFFGTCSTAAATAAKVITLVDADDFKLVPGVMIAVKYTVTNTASNCTLNVNGTGGKQVWYNVGVNTSNAVSLFGYANRYIYYIYDGTYWAFVNQGSNIDNNANTVPAAQCETAAATAAKAATCTNYTLTANTYLHFNIRYANTVAGAITMNVNSKGAEPIYINGAASSSSNHTLPAGSYIAFYNGTYWDFRTDGSFSGSRNSNVLSHIGWTAANTTNKLITQNDIAYWDGRFNDNHSNLEYCNKGAFGDAATYDVETTVANDSNLPTGAAVTAFVNSAINFGTIAASGSKTLSFTKGAVLIIYRGSGSIKVMYLIDYWGAIQTLAGTENSDISVTVSNNVITITNSRTTAVSYAAFVS